MPGLTAVIVPLLVLALILPPEAAKLKFVTVCQTIPVRVAVSLIPFVAQRGEMVPPLVPLPLPLFVMPRYA